MCPGSEDPAPIHQSDPSDQTDGRNVSDQSGGVRRAAKVDESDETGPQPQSIIKTKVGNRS